MHGAHNTRRNACILSAKNAHTERGRTVLVMRARCRSAGLTPHQRGWTDAGWTVSRLQLCNGPVNAAASARLFAKRQVVFYTIVFSSAFLSYARGQHGLQGARVMLSVRIGDPLSGRRDGSWCGAAEKNHEPLLVWEGGREVVGSRIRGSSTCPIAADRGEKCRTIYVCNSFLCDVVVVLVVWVIHLIYFVETIFSLRMYAQRVFSALFSGVLNTIACVNRTVVSEVFPAGLQLALVSNVRDSFWQGKCLPIFYRGLMCMCCGRVCTHTHTHCMWGTRM